MLVAATSKVIEKVYGGEAPNIDAANASGGDPGIGNLPFTGIDLTIVVIAAIGLILCGLALRSIAKDFEENG